MSRSNDSLIGEMADEAEHDGMCLLPGSKAMEKALRRRIDRDVVMPYPGIFARKRTWSALDRAERHRMLAKTLSLVHPDWVFCSHTAACLHGIDVSWRFLDRIHICSKSRPSNRKARFIQRHYIPKPEITQTAGALVTPPAQTVCHILYELSFRNGMPVADSAIGKLSLDIDELRDLIGKMAPGRSPKHRLTALTTLDHADGRAESGGESMARATMIETGFAPDHLQYKLADPVDDTKTMRIDFAWDSMVDELTLGELDGFVKYSDEKVLAGKTTAEALVAERKRESRVSLYGHPLIRFDMHDVWEPERLAKLLTIAGIRRLPPPHWTGDVYL